MSEVVLVTGGAGFIGSQCCKLLAAAGHIPVCYDDFSTGRRDFVKFGPLVEGDIRDREKLCAALREYRPTQVMHFAAKVEVEESVRNPTLYYDINVAGTVAVLDACREHEVRHFIFSSTAAVYGESVRGSASVDLLPAPITPYGRSKLVAEKILADCAEEHGMGLTIFRYFNASGSDPEGELGMRMESASHLIPRLLVAAAEATEVPVFGTDYPTPDGTCIRDYVHVWDVAKAHVAAARRPARVGATRTFNIGVGHGFSVREVVRSVERVTGKPVALVENPRRPGDASNLVAGDTELMRNELRWEPRFKDIDEIVQHAWTWLKSPRKP